MTRANPPMTQELFRSMCEHRDTGCMVWTGPVNRTGHPRYYSSSTDSSGGHMRSWVWKEILGHDKPFKSWRPNGSFGCSNKLCLSPEHLTWLIDFCPNGHSLLSGSPHLGHYSSGERYCRTCKFDSFKKQKYGLTTAMEEEVLRAQGGGCAICHGELGKIYRDHNHVSDEFRIRGLLCQQCNSGIGMFRDNVDFMKNAIAYIEDDGRSVDECLGRYEGSGD